MREAWRTRTDADAVARELLRPYHAHGFDPGFGGTVVALPGITGARDTRNIHDHAAVAEIDHMCSSFTRAQEYAAEIHGDDGIPLIHHHASNRGAIFHLPEQPVRHDPGVVHETVQAAELSRNTRHGSGDFPFVGDVHAVTARLHRVGRAQRFGLFEVVGIQIEKSDI